MQLINQKLDQRRLLCRRIRRRLGHLSAFPVFLPDWDQVLPDDFKRCQLRLADLAGLGDVVPHPARELHALLLQQLNDKVPELYQLALDQYNREGQDLYNQYGLYADRENQDYGRYRDTVSDYYANLDYLTDDARYKAEDDYGKYVDAYNRQYGQHRDSVSDYYSELDRLQEDARYQAQDEYGKYIDAYNREYGEHRDSVSDWQNEQNRADENYWNLYDREYNQYTNDRQLDYSNYWNEKDFEEGVRQFDEGQNNKNTGSNTGNVPETKPGGQYTAPEGWDEAQIRAFQKDMGISVDGVWGPQTQKAYNEYYGGDGLNGARKDEIDAWLEGVIAKAGPSFNPEVFLNGTSELKSDEEREYAKEALKYMGMLPVK